MPKENTIKKTNKTPVGLKGNDIIPIIHDALDTYYVPVYNGKAEPVKKPLSESITIISGDVRQLKKNQEIHTELLSGIKSRKDFIDSLINVFNKSDKYLGNLTKMWRIVLKVSVAISSLYGAYSIIKSIIE